MPCVLPAQQSGSINGAVTDESGGAIPNAQVVLTNAAQGTTFNATSNSTGEYGFPALEPGTYNLQVTAPGYKQYDATGIVLRVSRQERVDARLSVGAVTTQVQVVGSDLGTVQTESPEISFTITGKQITQLVLNGRNFTQLITLVPGVSNQTGQDEPGVGVYGSEAYSVNGGRTEYNNWEVDGGDMMDNGSNGTINVYPSVDAIGEVKVLTSNYGAQYGRNSWERLSPSSSREPSNFTVTCMSSFATTIQRAQLLPTSRPEDRKNDYGYTIGGPVFIPHLLPKNDKTFFFFSEEWRLETWFPARRHSISQEPSVGERGGNFSDVCPHQAAQSMQPTFPIVPSIPIPGPITRITRWRLTPTDRQCWSLFRPRM